MNSIRLGFNNTIPAPKDRVILTPEGFAKYLDDKKCFCLCDMLGDVFITGEDSTTIGADAKQWVDFF